MVIYLYIILLAEFLYEKNNTTTNFINLCQSIKRKESLSVDAIDKLISIKNENRELDIKLACSILLESKIEARRYLEDMNPTDREHFIKYPLMHLWVD